MIREREHGVACLAVRREAFCCFRIHRRQLPLSERVALALLEATLLLRLRHREPELEQVDARLHERALEAGRLVLLGLGVLGLLSGSGAGIGFGAFAVFVGVIVAGPLVALAGAKVFRSSPRCSGSKAASQPTTRRATRNVRPPPRTRSSSACTSSRSSRSPAPA